MRTIHGHSILLQAHRGVSTEYPENTLAAFRAACDQGYDLIELDPKFTRDGQCVVLHDHTVNRTGRTSSGEPLNEACPIDSLTLAEAQRLEYGSWKEARFAGEPLPLLSEVLELARARRMPVKLDNVIERFSPEQLERLHQVAEQSGLEELLGFTGASPDFLARTASRFPQATLHYDGPVDAPSLDRLAALAERHPLVIWMPYPNRLTSWCRMPSLTPERVRLVRALGARVGAWILEDEAELREVADLHQVDIVETTGSLKPDARKERAHGTD